MTASSPLLMRHLAIVAVLLALAAGCSSSDQEATAPVVPELRVASFDFAESELLSELYAQTAEAVGIPVARLGAAGPREVVAPALVSGAIDLVPEYAGTALAFHEGTAQSSALADVVSALDEALRPRGLTALQAAPALDTNVFVVTAAIAESQSLITISDLAGAGLTRFGGPAECQSRPLCLGGLRDVYGITFDEFTAHPSLAFTSEALRRDEVDVGLLFSTAPELDAADLTALHDDQDLQPADHIIPVVRAAALTTWPALQPALDRLSAGLTTEDLREMNRRVADGTPIVDVASDWLTDHEVGR